MSEPVDPSKRVASLQDFLKVIELRQMLTYELIAARTQNKIETMEDTRQDLSAQTRVEETLLETRFRLEVEAPNARYLADIGGVYAIDGPVQVSPEIVGEFMGQVGLMAVFPYLREAVSGLAARLGAPIPVIGLIRRGEYEFALNAPSEAKQ
jgi:hypothetical protein